MANAKPGGDEGGDDDGERERSLEVSLDESEAYMLSDSMMLATKRGRIKLKALRRWRWEMDLQNKVRLDELIPILPEVS